MYYDRAPSKKGQDLLPILATQRWHNVIVAGRHSHPCPVAASGRICEHLTIAKTPGDPTRLTRSAGRGRRIIAQVVPVTALTHFNWMNNETVTNRQIKT